MAIITLADAKTYLNVTNNTKDALIQEYVDAATPVIEFIVGPVVQATVDEWHDGGTPTLVLRRRPVLSVEVVTEYSGNVAYTLTQEATPNLGVSYSYTISDADRLTRRSGGGAAINFAAGVQNIHVAYTVGRASVPANVKLGALELVAHWFRQTQQGGRPSFAGSTAVEDMTSPSPGYAIPNRVRELLSPHKRAPRIG